MIFQPENGGLPPGHYKMATQHTMSLLADGPPNLDDPDTTAEFFRMIFEVSDNDVHQIQGWRSELNYPQVARLFRMIENDATDVVIPMYGTPEREKKNPDRRSQTPQRRPRNPAAAQKNQTVDGPSLPEPTAGFAAHRVDCPDDAWTLRVAGQLRPGYRHRRNHRPGPRPVNSLTVLRDTPEVV